MATKNELNLAELKTLGFHNDSIKEIQSVWRLPKEHIHKVKQSIDTVSSRYGLFANVPIICKGEGCPFLKTCSLSEEERPTNYRCPLEMGAILSRFERYCAEFEVTERDAVDLGQIKQLVDLEIMLMRCDSKMAISADFIEEVLKDVTKNGTRIYESTVTQASQFKLTLIERHSKILKDLAATRSSKKDKKIEDDASKTASILMRRVQELATGLGVKSQDVLEVDYDEDYADDTIIDERDYDESCVIIDSEEEE